MTENKHFYLGWFRKCPKCGRGGCVDAHFLRDRPWHKWRGPYFRVKHRYGVYSPEKYRRLRESGLSSSEAKRKNHKITKYDYVCYFGKVNPLPDKPVPTPES